MLTNMLDVESIRAQFPGLEGTANGKDFVYLDTGASAQKPLAVIERMNHFLRHEYGTVHRGLYQRSIASTQTYEAARATVAQFLSAPSAENIVFTMGCTDALNLIAWSWGRKHLSAGDRILITAMEHHANIVPWQLICEQTGAELIVCPIDDAGNLDLDTYAELLDERVKLVSCVHISNALGTINPVKKMAAQAHAVGAVFVVDGAQSAPHIAIDVQDLDCDFFVFAGHKIYGPTGIGALYAKADVLDSMPPWRGGGEMIDRVTFKKTTYAKPPGRFEAGTPPIVEAIGMAAACDWLMNIDLEAIAKKDEDLFSYAEKSINTIPGLRRIGMAEQRSTVLSFIIGDAHASDISNILDMEGIAIRAGHHCAQPVMDRLGIPATARISLGIYNNYHDIDRAAAALEKVSELFAE